mgnify:CR=1 FL=1
MLGCRDSDNEEYYKEDNDYQSENDLFHSYIIVDDARYGSLTNFEYGNATEQARAAAKHAQQTGSEVEGTPYGSTFEPVTVGAGVPVAPDFMP